MAAQIRSTVRMWASQLLMLCNARNAPQVLGCKLVEVASEVFQEPYDSRYIHNLKATIQYLLGYMLRAYAGLFGS